MAFRVSLLQKQECKTGLTFRETIFRGRREEHAHGEKIAIPPADVAPLANRQIVRHPDATHWVQWDEPDAVSEALIEFLNEK